MLNKDEASLIHRARQGDRDAIAALYQDHVQAIYRYISYRVPEEMGAPQVELKVYNLRGALVRTLVDRIHTPGMYSVEWNGRDGGGRELPSGIYFYRLKAGSTAINRKMVLIR